MRRIAIFCALLLNISLPCVSARAASITGTWSVAASTQADRVHLRLEYRHSDAHGDQEWDESRDVPLTSLHGVSAADLRAGTHDFTVVADAGSFHAHGAFNGGKGGGTWTFAPNPGFAAALQHRGAGTPTQEQQFQLAIGGFQLATLDELLRDGFKTPSVSDLVAMIDHGVDAAYVARMKGLRFSSKSVAELIRLRDHGVEPAYAAQILQYAPSASADDLVDLQDHGVSVAFVQRMRQHGYSHLSVADLIRLRDHGY